MAAVKNSDDKPGPSQGLAPEAVFREKLKNAVPGLTEVVFTDNRRQLASVKKNPGGSLSVRLQHGFRAACGGDFAALAQFIAKPDPASRSALSGFVTRNQGVFAQAAEKPATRPRVIHCYPRGLNRDLLDIMKKVADEYGIDADGIYITFGNDPLGRLTGGGEPSMKRGSRSRSIRFGSFWAEKRLIRIHPLLDSLDMPQYFVEYIVYHELLHAACPQVKAGGRKTVHTAEFRRRERLFKRYEDAVRFEKEWTSRFL